MSVVEVEGKNLFATAENQIITTPVQEEIQPVEL